MKLILFTFLVPIFGKPLEDISNIYTENSEFFTDFSNENKILNLNLDPSEYQHYWNIDLIKQKEYLYPDELSRLIMDTKAVHRYPGSSRNFNTIPEHLMQFYKCHNIPSRFYRNFAYNFLTEITGHIICIFNMFEGNLNNAELSFQVLERASDVNDIYVHDSYFIGTIVMSKYGDLLSSKRITYLGENDLINSTKIKEDIYIGRLALDNVHN